MIETLNYLESPEVLTKGSDNECYNFQFRNVYIQSPVNTSNGNSGNNSGDKMEPTGMQAT